MDRQAGSFLGPDCAPTSECPSFGIPAERRAQIRVPNVPRSRIAERAPFRIHEHAEYRVFERTSLQRAYVIPCRKWGCSLCYGHIAACWCLQHSIGRGCRVHTCVMAIGAHFKMHLLPQFCSNRVDFFYKTQETQTQKMMDQNFEIRIL